MKILRFEVGPFLENTYLLACERTGRGVVVDPGGENERVLEAAGREGIELLGIWNTHGHIDHIWGAEELRRERGLEFVLHASDRFLVDSLAEQAAMFGLPEPQVPQIDRAWETGIEVTLGEESFRVVHTPGHSPGSVSFLGKGWALVGDVLFAGSVGRVDIPGGDGPTLLQSIRRELLPLPAATRVYPGHGPATTMGAEGRTNPFLLTGAEELLGLGAEAAGDR